MIENRQPRGLWFYATLVASVVAVIGLLLSLLPYALMQGADAAGFSLVLGIFFSEFVMVLSALGLLGYLKTSERTPLVRRIARLNVFLLVGGACMGLWLFLS